MNARTWKWLVVGWMAVQVGALAETATVLKVIDGDTCQLDDQRLIRYLGINAPEKGDPFANESTQANNTFQEPRRAGDRFDRLAGVGRGESPVSGSAFHPASWRQSHVTHRNGQELSRRVVLGQPIDDLEQ